MKLWPKLGGCLLLLVACRQPNPEWEGAADGMVTSGPVPTSSETGGGPGSTSQTSNVDTPPVVTEGQDCNNDQQCPDGWVCGPMGCQPLGAPGDPCSGNGDCQGVCGPNDTCQTGEPGDPCTSNSHCVGGVMCIDGVCGGGGGSSSDGTTTSGSTTTGASMG